MPTHPVPNVYPSAAAAAEAGAAYVAQALREAPLGRPLSLAVSGGSTPAPLYRALARLSLPWHRLHVFWADERFVPPTDERSNERLVRESLLAHGLVPESFVHPVPTNAATPQAAAEAYDATLRQVLGPDGGLTVALLGAGEDGHTASLFPGQPLDHPGRRAVHVHAPDTSPVRDRITLTRELFAASDHVVFFVTGAGKADVVENAFCPTPTTVAFPASTIKARTGAEWFMDRDAMGDCALVLKRHEA